MRETELFEYFKQHQLANVDFTLGTIDVFAPAHNQFSKEKIKICKDVGSKNEDGYTRIWCGNGKKEIGKALKMRYRLMYYLYYGSIPENCEIDHIDRNRSNDAINNLRAVTRQENCSYSKHAEVRNKYTESQIIDVCLLLQNTTMSDLDISKQTSLSRNYVRDIKTRRKKVELSKAYVWKHRNW